jgi:hypothetical protein
MKEQARAQELSDRARRLQAVKHRAFMADVRAGMTRQQLVEKHGAEYLGFCEREGIAKE